jgi:hypothetical protein
VKSCGENSCAQTNDEEAGKVYFIEILRVEKEIGNAQVFAEAACDHRKENHPAKHQHMITLQVIEQ